MITYKEQTTLIGVSELRKGIDKILGMARKGLVVIEKRHRPAAVLMSSKEYKRLQRVLETAEDIVLGFIAQERYAKAKENDYVAIEKLLS